jgi:hypothetical protein
MKKRFFAIGIISLLIMLCFPVGNTTCLDAPEFTIIFLDKDTAIITYLGNDDFPVAENVRCVLRYKCLIPLIMPRKTETITSLNDGQSIEVSLNLDQGFIFGFGSLKLKVSVNAGNIPGTWSNSIDTGLFLIGLFIIIPP